MAWAESAQSVHPDPDVRPLVSRTCWLSSRVLSDLKKFPCAPPLKRGRIFRAEQKLLFVTLTPFLKKGFSDTVAWVRQTLTVLPRQAEGPGSSSAFLLNSSALVGRTTQAVGPDNALYTEAQASPWILCRHGLETVFGVAL